MADVELSDHRSEWQSAFLQIRGELHDAFAPQVVAVEHIGSTAVPGLCAKPVIDVLLGVPALACVEPAMAALAGAGYGYVARYERQIPQRRYFVKAASTCPRVHLHGVCQGSPLWNDYLGFRNALRADEDLRRRYAALKTALARRYAHDKSAYTEAKAPFIQAVLAAAGAQPTGTSWRRAR